LRHPVITLAVSLSLAGACGPSSAPRPNPAAESAAASDAAQAKAREAAVAARESERLAALWEYNNVAVAGGHQRSALIRSANGVDTTGLGAKAVSLVFRDHPSWGKSSYLILQDGDFECGAGCSVSVTVDEAAPKSMAARRPRTDEAIAMFINDWQTLWRLTARAKRMAIEFPVKGRGKLTATFEVGGLDRSVLPGWDGAALR